MYEKTNTLCCQSVLYIPSFPLGLWSSPSLEGINPRKKMFSRKRGETSLAISFCLRWATHIFKDRLLYWRLVWCNTSFKFMKISYLCSPFHKDWIGISKSKISQNPSTLFKTLTKKVHCSCCFFSKTIKGFALCLWYWSNITCAQETQTKQRKTPPSSYRVFFFHWYPHKKVKVWKT